MNRYQKLFVITLLFLIPLLNTASAATAKPATDDIELGPVVVTANRSEQHLDNVAQSITVIDRADIAAAPAASVADLLEYAAGVDVRQRGAGGSQADVSIRGGSTEQTLILVNGISSANPQTGHHNMDIPVAIADIERIEIIKGPGARIYGANAMAGVINIITRRDSAPTVSARLEGGDFNYQASALRGTFTTASWHNNISAAQSYSSGFEQHEPTGFNNRNISYSGHGDLFGHASEVGISFGDKKFGASRFYFNSPHQKEETESLLSYIRSEFTAGKLTIKPQLVYQHHNDIYKFGYGGRWYSNDTDTDKYSGGFIADITTALGDTSFGLSGEREKINSSNLGDHQRSSCSLFLNQQTELLPDLRLGGGLSAVYYSDWGWKYWPGVEMNYRISTHLRWFASVARSFRIPTYVEMYYNSPANIGDADLDPEKAWSYETGLRWRQKRLSANISVFRRESDDIIDWLRRDSASPWRVSNLTSTTTSGFEVGVDIRQPLAALPQIGRVSLDYTYLDHDADYRGLQSKYTLDNLRHQLHATLYCDWHPRLTHVIKARVEQRMCGDSSVIVDTRLGFAASDAVEIYVEGNNLLDEEYIEAGDAPMPGRWLLAGISVHRDLL